MNEIVEIGPFVLNKGLLVIIISLVCGWGVIRLCWRYFGDQAAPLLELLMNAALLVLVFWKLGHLLTTPSLLWERPMTLLLMSGSSREIGIGLIAAAGFITYRLKKGRLEYRLFLDMLAFGSTIALLVSSMLLWRYGRPTDLPWGIQDGFGESFYHPLNVYMLVLTLGLGYRLWKKVSADEAGRGIIFRETAITVGAGGLVISLVDRTSDSLIFLLSSTQLLFLGLAIIGIIFPVHTHNRNKRKEMTYMQPNENKGDSLEQREHERENENKSNQGNSGDIVDKKLDGPNRPST